MKKWLVLAFLLIAASAYASSVVISKVGDPLFCADCHYTEYKNYSAFINYSVLPAHKEKKITCIECHSSPGIESGMAVRKLLINAQIVNYSLPAINRLLRSNFTFNQSFNVSDFSILKANCAKCHNIKNIKSNTFNHSIINSSGCENCHILHKGEPLKEKNAFWRRLGEGGHRNRTCGDCHGTDTTKIELPQCMKCHKPHLKGAQWDRKICLGCHDNPHLPQRNAVFKGNITKQMCSACHNIIYQTLTTYDSKHNKNVPACIKCHPKHRVKPSCNDCHMPHGPRHPGSSCTSCHGYVSKCRDCHTNPHAPKSGLPAISGGEQFTEYAKQAGQKAKG